MKYCFLFFSVFVFLFCGQLVSAASQPQNVDRVVVRYPQDRVVFRPEAIYIVNIAPNYMCHIELPESAETIVVANPARYEVIPPAQYGSGSEGGSSASGSDSGRTIFVKALQVQQTPISENATTDQTLDTNMTVRLVSGRTLYLRLRNVTREEETVYGCSFYEEAKFERIRGVTGSGSVSPRQLDQITRTESELTPGKSLVVDQSLMLKARSVLQEMLRGRSAPRVVIQRREQDTDFQLKADRVGRYLVVSIYVNSSQSHVLSTPNWKLDKSVVAPLVADPVFPPQIVAGGVRMGVILDVPAWATINGVGPNAVVMSVAVRNRMIEWAVPILKLSGLDETGLGPQKDFSEDERATSEMSFQREVKRSDLTLNIVQEQLVRLMDSTSIRSSKVTTYQEKDYLVGAMAERYGNWVMVLLFVERRLGSKPLNLEDVQILRNGQPVDFEIVLQPFPQKLETKPLVSGLLIRNPGEVSFFQYELKVDGRKTRLNVPVHESETSFNLQPVEPGFRIEQPSVVVQPRLEYEQNGIEIRSVDARQVKGEFWVSFVVQVKSEGDLTQMAAISDTGQVSQCVSSRERWAAGEVGKVTFIFPLFTSTVTVKWVRRSVNESSVFGPYHRL